MCLASVKKKDLLAVGLMWASLGVDILFNGAIVPLMPIYVAEMSGNDSKGVVAFDGNASGDNATQDQEENMNSMITGMLLSLSQWTQLPTVVFVGPLIDKIGSDVPLFIGYFVVTASTTGFAFASSYWPLIICRALQGVGSAFIQTAGVSLVADIFRGDDEQRGKMIGVAMCGATVGLIVGPPFGALLYQTGSKAAPFLAIAGMTVVIALFQLSVRRPRIRKPEKSESSPWKAQLRLIRDPFILMCTLTIVLGFLGNAVLEAVLPTYVLGNSNSETWMTGVVFLGLNLSFALSMPALTLLSSRVGRWPIAFTSFIVGALAFAAYPFSRSFAGLLGLGVPAGIALAAVDAVIYPIIAQLVDKRIGEAVYGSAYALANVATCVAFAVGPILAGALMSSYGFATVMYVTAGLTIFALLPTWMLRKPLNSPAVLGESSNLVKDDPEVLNRLNSKSDRKE